MTTTPNGNPAWTRSADHTFYGGHLQKANYNGEPVCNPKTDVDAAAICRLAADMATVVRMTPFAQINLTSAGTGAAVTVNQCRLMTGATSVAYAGTAPPTGFPAVTQLTAGVYTVEIGKTYTDDYSVSGTFEPEFCGAYCTSYTCEVKAYVSGTAMVYVEAYTSTGSGVTSETFNVWIS